MRLRSVVATLVGCALFTISQAGDAPESTFPFAMQGGRPVVDAEINGVHVSLLLDLDGPARIGALR